MKKNLIYLMGVILALNFVACGDDDKPGKDDPKWWEYAGVFGDKNILSVNNKSITDGTKTVTLQEGVGEEATVILKNIFPEVAEVKLADVELTEKEDGTYIFAIDTLIADTKYSINAVLTPGTMAKATDDKAVAKLALTYTHKITSATVGTWNLNFTENYGQNYADFIFSAVTNNPEVDIMAPFMGLGIGRMISEKVDAVQVNFSEDGKFTFQWRPVGSKEFQTLPKQILAALAAMGLDFTYFTDKDKLYLSFPKEINGVDIFTLLGGMPEIKKFAPIIKSLLVEQSGYYLFPINQTIKDGKADFYIAEDIISKVATIVEPMMEGEDFGDYDGTIQPIVTALKTAKEAKIGLAFTKE